MVTLTKPEIKKEFQRVFQFVVKHKDSNMNWTNKDIRKFLRWAWYYKRLFIIYDNRRIAAIGIMWRTDHPENASGYLSFERTEFGDYLYVYQVLVHPNYKMRGLLFQLLYEAKKRYNGVKRAFWKDRKGRLRIIEVNRLMGDLSKWAIRTEIKSDLRLN